MSTSRDSRRDRVERLSRQMRLMSSFDALFSQAVADRIGMHPTDIETLDLLNTLGPMTPGILSQRTGLSTGATTRMIDRLERAGYVRRQPAADRRSVIIVPRWENLDAVAELFAPLADGLAEVWSEYEDDQLDLFAEFLRRSSARVAEVNARLRATPGPDKTPEAT